jgi:hypothetical protein
MNSPSLGCVAPATPPLTLAPVSTTLWRHELSVIHRKGTSTYRLTIKGLIFPGRCFLCKSTGKGIAFCFGLNHRIGNALPSQMIRKIETIDGCE